jgi:RND family efflux transporter MFP subunit
MRSTLMSARHAKMIGLLVAAVVVIGALGFLRFAGGGPLAEADTPGPTGVTPERRTPVVVTAASTRLFEERLVVQGNLEAKDFAMVSARTPGTLEQLYVDEGDAVVASETRLFQVDAVKVTKALEVSKQELAVARCASQEKQANRERFEADLHKAELDYQRFQRLFKERVVSEDALEQQESRYKQASAMLKHAQSLVLLGVEQERQAEAAVAIAEKDLSDSLVVAPISGIVNQRFREVGETVEVGKPLIRIEDPSEVEVSAFLPAQYYPRVVEGETPVRVNVYGIDVGKRTVSYKSPTINPKLRTFEIKCIVSNPPKGVVPGAMAEIQVLLAQRERLGVPAEALQARGGASVLFVVDDGAARMIPVETGLDTDGWVEVTSGEVSESTPVITMGQYLVNDGSPVTVQEGNV